MAKREIPELRVMFDTSVLFTPKNASNLLNLKIENLIKEFSSVLDLKVTWYLPNIVLMEREFQMLKEGKILLPSISKLEKLLGHGLNITEEIVHDSIKKTIEKQVKEFSINIVSLDTKGIDWGKIIEKSAYRIPPFEDNEKEKGFRDELIQQAFLQLIKNSPKTPSICRVVFVGRDRLLCHSLNIEIENISNVKIFSELEDLKSLINTLTSQVQVELIDKISGKAGKLFFEKENKATLLYREKINEQIEEKYKAKLDELPTGGHRRSNGKWYISNPRFFKKKNQKITWKTRIDIVSKALKSVQENSPLFLPPEVTSQEPKDVSPLNLLDGGLFNFSTNKISTLLGGSYKEELVANGRTTFEVIWSVTVTTTHNLISPKIEAINFIEINWNDRVEEENE